MLKLLVNVSTLISHPFMLVPSVIINFPKIATMIGFKIGALPFTYLGVPIFKGKPKKSHLQPIADKVKMKLAAWKASLLSMEGRVQLIRSVVCNALFLLKR